ncbi:MAG: tRNA wybutosine-synthesizing 3 family protein [Nanoarchaeota archaeon]|nr:hypothetical protein [Nanoarchaeota archaeon]
MKKDKSPQGFYDPDIISLLDKINAHQGRETTSSCSGRITLMKGTKKGAAVWVYKTHGQADWQEIYEIIQKELHDSDEEQLRFFYEPLIVHVKCGNLNKAEELLATLLKNGFKKCRLISFKNFIIEINDTGSMETIVTMDLSKSYIQKLIFEANRRLAETKENIKKIENLF